MEFLLTHIVYIIIIGFIIAGLGVVWAYAAAHNAKKRDPEMQRMQDKACENCSLASMCTRFGTEDKSCDEFSHE